MGMIIVICVVILIYFIFKVLAAVDRPSPVSPQDNPDIPNEFVVFDTETTGLDSFKHQIIEIGAIKVNKHTESQQTYQALIKIDKKIPKKAIEIHGITDDMLQKDGIPLEVALKEFKEFIGDLPTVAFNADFDKAFINNAAERVGMKNIIKRPTCALKLARKAWPKLANHKLSTLASIGGFDTEGLHRSIADCKATIMVYVAAVPIVKAKYRGR